MSNIPRHIHQEVDPFLEQPPLIKANIAKYHNPKVILTDKSRVMFDVSDRLTKVWNRACGYKINSKQVRSHDIALNCQPKSYETLG